MEMNQDKEMNNTSPAEYYEVMNPEKVAEKEKKDPIQEMMQEMAEDPEHEPKKVMLGSFLFALLYTFCVYKNAEGITYPFFVGGSLALLFYCFKKCGRTVSKGSKWIAASMMLLGILQCTTDSRVVIHFNRFMIWGLGLVLLLKTMWTEETLTWDMGKWIRKLLGHAFWSPFKGFEIFPDGWDVFRERTESREKYKRSGKIAMAILLAGAITIPLLVFIIIMLSSADVLFRAFIEKIVDTLFHWNIPEFLTNEDLWLSLLMFGSSLLVSYGAWQALKKEEEAIEEGEQKPKEQLVGYIIVGAVGMVYLLFSFFQIFGLFLGKMSLPEGYTYAGYAREGFFQLAFLCGMNIVLVLIICKYFRLNQLMKIMLLVICGCTYIMIASSAYKMILYVKAYQLTFLRLAVLWALVVMTVLLAGVVLRIVSERERLVEFFFITLLSAYCIFVFARPDYLIASYNVAHVTDSTSKRTKVDSRYLVGDLSADAVPVWIRSENISFSDGKLYTLEKLVMMKDEMTFRTFNFSKYYAGVLAEKRIADLQENDNNEEEKEGADIDTDLPAGDSQDAFESQDFASEDAEMDVFAIPEYWLTTEPDATWEFEDGSKLMLVPVDRAAGSNFYVMLGTTSEKPDEIIVVNDDPFYSMGAGKVEMQFLNSQLGFVTMLLNGGDNGILLRTEDGGRTFAFVDITPMVVESEVNEGNFFTPFDTPEDIAEKDGVLCLIMGQGTDADYYVNDHLASAVYVSFDDGVSWNYLKTE